jgi:lipid II:glycine glycyltransferase (peptidoglycan interpeptide bridge formation enzyme)
MKRNRAAAKYPLQWFDAVYKEMVGRHLGVFLFAELNRVAVAGVVLINSPNSTHYLHNGSQYEFLKFCPNELLIHFSLEEAVKKGNSCFDFMGSGAKDLSLLQFKEKWGGQSKDVCTYVKDYHPFRCKILELGKRLGNSGIGSGLLKLIWD